ncbi:MAG: ABC transporter permease, partial [Pseudomonadota bacterium]
MSRLWHKVRPALSVQLGALVLVLLGNWALFPGFFDLSMQDGRLFGSLIDVMNRGAPVAILAVGMTLVIATRGVDLSVGAVMAVSGAIAATLVEAGYPAGVAVPLALVAGVVCGAWNGFLIAVLEMQPIVATLVLMVAGRGLAQLITEGSIVTFDNPWLVFLGDGTILGLPMSVILLAMLAAATMLVVRRTALGLFIEAVGVNPSAARFAAAYFSLKANISSLACPAARANASPGAAAAAADAEQGNARIGAPALAEDGAALVAGSLGQNHLAFIDGEAAELGDGLE